MTLLARTPKLKISKIHKMTQSKEKKMQDDRVSAIFKQQHFYSNYTTFSKP
jgi:hypothetical protein